MRLLFEGGFYSRAAFIGEFTVCTLYVVQTAHRVCDESFQIIPNCLRAGDAKHRKRNVWTYTVVSFLPRIN